MQHIATVAVLHWTIEYLSQGQLITKNKNESFKGKQIKFRYVLVKSGFFLTSVAEKTKIQAQNSRKKLNLREALSSS